MNGDNRYGGMLFTERTFDVVDTLREIGRLMAQVALAWAAGQPGVCSVLVGASRPEQLKENIASLLVDLSPAQQGRSDAVGAPPMLNPYFVFELCVSASLAARRSRPDASDRILALADDRLAYNPR